MKEELGLDTEIGRFVGVLEHKFTDKKGKEYEEINLIFEVELEEENPSSIEGHLEFLWSPPVEFKTRKLLPSSLPELLEKWEKTGLPFHHNQRDSTPR